jgi:hypothetical protein
LQVHDWNNRQINLQVQDKPDHYHGQDDEAQGPILDEALYAGSSKETV